MHWTQNSVFLHSGVVILSQLFWKKIAIKIWFHATKKWFIKIKVELKVSGLYSVFKDSIFPGQQSKENCCMTLYLLLLRIAHWLFVRRYLVHRLLRIISKQSALKIILIVHFKQVWSRRLSGCSCLTKLQAHQQRKIDWVIYANWMWTDSHKLYSKSTLKQ